MVELKNDINKETTEEKINSVFTDFLQGFAHFTVPYLLFLLPAIFVLIAVTSKIGFYLMSAYVIHIILDRSYENGSQPWQWFRNGRFFHWYAEYYPAKLVKEADLDPSRNYLFGYHPHGLMAMGAYTNIALNVTGFDETFPGIKNRLTSLAFNFFIPLNREFFLRTGVASSSKKSISNIYAKGPGHSCTIVVGGAAEAIRSEPGKADLVIKNRFGFVKIAIQNGADLVPIFGFGENNLVHLVYPEPGTWGYTIQNFLKTKMGFYLPSWRGRLPWAEGRGHMFRKVPLTAVVGKPIRIEKDPNPSKEKVQAIHKQYCDALKDLYDRNKVKYNPEPNLPIPEINFI